jgi:uncharacterized protein YwgA
MSPLLTNTRDQALLALVIQEASAAAKDAHWYVGRTAVQKVMYFLQVLDVPMGYRFDIHFYGPYCYDITRDADWLVADSVVADSSTNPDTYSNYTPGDSIQELLTQYPDVENWRKCVHDVVNALIPLEPRHLELLATLDYLYRQQKATKHTGSLKEAVVCRFMEIKGDKFTRDEVERTYEAMRTIGFVEAT